MENIQDLLLEKKEDSILGLSGLNNLGNTCFLNTSLQCISNCHEFIDFLLLDLYYKQINIDNPIGSGGNLIKAFANLMKQMWYGNQHMLTPMEFKRCIEKFKPIVLRYFLL